MSRVIKKIIKLWMNECEEKFTKKLVNAYVIVTLLFYEWLWTISFFSIQAYHHKITCKESYGELKEKEFEIYKKIIIYFIDIHQYALKWYNLH